MAQLSKLDQNYVLAVSLKQLTNTQWEPGRTSAEWTFELPEQMFAGQAAVRLRGLGVSVVGPKPEAPEPVKGQKAPKVEPPKPEVQKAEGFWSARLTPPAKAMMKGISGAPRELDQKGIAVCHLGTVTDRESREPEVAGVSVLHNASPIGKWKLTLSAQSTDGMSTAKLEDVHMYLHLAVRGV